MTRQEILSKIEHITTNIIINDFSPKLVFHDIKHIRRVVKAVEEIGVYEKLNEEQIQLVQIAAWCNFLGFAHLDEFKKVGNPQDFFKSCTHCSLLMVDHIFDKHQLPLDLMPDIKQLISQATADVGEKHSLLDKVLIDAIGFNLSTKKGKKRIKNLYEELLLTGALNVGTLGWYELALDYFKNYKGLTRYGKEMIEPKMEINYLELQKEHKNLKKQHDYALQKELDVSETDLKELKKKLKASKGRDDRGIQTMFRTTSKNHYTLNQMVDRKASIMISVNSIILSIIIGGMINTTNIEGFGVVVPIFIMIFASFFSIIFAIIAIRPEVTHGKFTAEEISAKKGNLFGLTIPI